MIRHCQQWGGYLEYQVALDMKGGVYFPPRFSAVTAGILGADRYDGEGKRLPRAVGSARRSVRPGVGNFADWPILTWGWAEWPVQWVGNRWRSWGSAGHYCRLVPAVARY